MKGYVLQMDCVRVVRRRRLLVRHRALRPDRQRRQRQTVLVRLEGDVLEEWL